MMGQLKNLIGKKFGNLTVISDAGTKKYNNQSVHLWNALCICGKNAVVSAGHLTSGHTTSCGCRQGRFKHGLSRTKTKGVTREYKMWNEARGNAKKKNIPCTISLNDIFIPAICPLLGISLDKNAPNLSDNLPSLDRIDNTKGYTPENIWVISWKANKLKSNSTVQELKMMVERLEEKLLEKQVESR